MTRDKKVEKISPEQAYTVILEWVYQTDGEFSNKNLWRREFIRHLANTIKRIK